MKPTLTANNVHNMQTTRHFKAARIHTYFSTSQIYGNATKIAVKIREIKVDFHGIIKLCRL